MGLDLFRGIEVVAEKKLIGNRLVMSLAEDRTKELWQGFMSRRKEIGNPLSKELISMQVYDDLLKVKEFNSTTQFEKWAVVEVKDYAKIPEGMVSYTLSGGLYAVFVHRGCPVPFQGRRNIFLGNGCQIRNINWIIGSILRLWEVNTGTTIQVRKKRYGCQLKEKIKYKEIWKESHL